ncbi:MAG TPA: hypothetical protein VFH40_07425 [Gemmatimonadales bacterium]|jgi:hypothetical protein|nr:hypothetical protein [Gemmatimonadales bacterium]
MCRSALVLLVLLVTLTPAAHSQEHYTLGPVQRIILLDIKPGKGREFWTDLRQNVRPLYDEYKRQGLIQDYSVGLKTTAEGPQDWDVALILTFKNWAALDVFATKGDSVSMRYYGSYGKRSEAGARRSDAGTVISSFLVRGVTLKELPR